MAKQRGVSRNELESAVSDWLKNIEGQYWGTLGRAYRKYKRIDLWKKLGVILVGGGGVLLKKRKLSFLKKVDDFWPLPEKYYWFNLPQVGYLEKSDDFVEEDTEMLMQVAVGLARPGPDIVRFHKAPEVSDYPEAEKYVRPSQEEMGYGEK